MPPTATGSRRCCETCSRRTRRCSGSRQGQPVSEADLEALSSLVLTQDPMLDLHDLVEYYPDCAGQLDLAIRSIIGLDAVGGPRAVHRLRPPAQPELGADSGSWTCSRTTSPSTAPSRLPACTSRRSPRSTPTASTACSPTKVQANAVIKIIEFVPDRRKKGVPWHDYRTHCGTRSTNSGRSSGPEASPTRSRSSSRSPS